MPRSPAVFAACILALAACTGSRSPDTRERGAARDTTAPDSIAAPLIPATATLNDAGRVVRDPERGGLPSDTQLAARVVEGYRIFRQTGRYAAAFVGNGLTCGNCHLNAGQRDRGMPLVGVAGVFPEYRARSGRLISLEDRIRDCFERSMNGAAPAFESRELLSVAAYIAWLSDGQPVGRSPAWRGRNTIPKAAQVPVAQLDTAAGHAVYTRVCVGCHGADGEGVTLGTVRPGPLWGPRSWNDGAGMARVYTAAGFIRWAMPLTAPGSLSDREAQEVAAYIDSQPRPAFPRKAGDYPSSAIPPDAVYYPKHPASSAAKG
ncbi:MAG TPA: c-type cytochrome [Longimicrobiaceae bacterium]